MQFMVSQHLFVRQDPYSQLMSLQNMYAQTSINETAINYVQKIMQEMVSPQHLFVRQVRNKSVAEDMMA
jgi:hypothetical protein